MIRINLLPFRAARKKENVRMQVSVFLLSVLLLGVVLGWYHFHLLEIIHKKTEQKNETQRQLDDYNKKAQEVEKIKKELALLNQKLEIIETLNYNRSEAFRLIDSITKMVVEKRMWFTGFEAMEQVVSTPRKDKDGKPTKERDEKIFTDIKLNGIALDEKTIADFMDRLQKSDLFNYVKLISIKRETFKSKADITLQNFFILCQRTPVMKPKEEDVPKKAEAKKPEADASKTDVKSPEAEAKKEEKK